MVQIIPKRQSFGEQVGQNLGAGLSQGVTQGMQQKMKLKQIAAEQEAKISAFKKYQEMRNPKKAFADEVGKEPSIEKGSVEPAELSEDEAMLEDYLFPTVGKGAREREKINLKKQQIEQAQVDKSYEIHKPYIDKVTSQYQGFETDMKPRLLQMQGLDDKNLINPTPAKFLDLIGIPLGALENPGSELYQKLSQDLLKGLPETYGNRILQVEVENFLKTIPTLLNSPEGRRMISSNMLKLGEMKEAYYNEMRRQQVNLLDKNAKFPKDFEQRIFDNVLPQINRINEEFVKLSEIKHVPPNTVPYFDPQGEISFVPKTEEALQWANSHGGRRIW